MIKFSNPDGLPSHTTVSNAETGESLSKVLPIKYGAKIEIGRNEIVATCEIAMMQLDLAVGRAEFRTINPISQRYESVRAIEFRDGTRVEIAEDGTPSVAAAAKD
ncbi:hypothetical protein ABIE89_006482 [Bradyrhizobium niftali]|uniref:hypothetical protein n=1 Tax=Bradyrhizobium niftali TaxID=2560055 RepID=UPI0038364E99